MNRPDYASPCGGCVCNICVKSAYPIYKHTEEERQLSDCYHCEDCWNYGHEVGTKRTYIDNCEEFVLMDAAAVARRRKFKVVKK